MILVDVEVVEVESKMKMKIEEVWNFENSDISDTVIKEKAKKKKRKNPRNRFKLLGSMGAHLSS